MTYDEARQQTVLFGGYSPFKNDTWVWDGQNWTQKSPATSPSARFGAAMAYDEAHQKAVLFGGGISTFAVTGDTWTWDGSNWSQQSPSTAPSSRDESAMAYDPAIGKIVLFGGSTSGSVALNDTWTWDGSSWTQLSPASSPSPRRDMSMAYDPVRRVLVLFGGQLNSTSTFYNDTWTFDGTSWTQQSPTNAPSVRGGYALAYDPVLQGTVLFGGWISGSAYNDTWLWNGSNWLSAGTIASPSGRSDMGVAYDALHSAVTIFGGYGTAYLNDTWTYNTLIPTLTKSVTSPPPTGPYGRGDVVTFNVTIGNAGNSAMPNVMLTDTPTGLVEAGTTLQVGTQTPVACGALGAAPTLPTSLPCATVGPSLYIYNLSIPAYSSLVVAYKAITSGADRQCSTANNGVVAGVFGHTTDGSTFGQSSATSLPTPLTVCGTGLGLENWWAYASESIGQMATAQVNAGDGNIVIQQSDFTPMSVHGHLGLGLRRTYNSQEPGEVSLPGSLGKGWTFNISEAGDLGDLGTGGDGLYVPAAESVIGPAPVTLVDQDGTRHVFTPSALSIKLSGLPVSSPLAPLAPVVLHLDPGYATLCVDETYASPAGVHLSLWRYVETTGSTCSGLTASNTLVLGFAAERPDRLRSEFAWDGHLVDLRDGIGNEIQYTYANASSPTLPSLGNLQTIIEPATGRKFAFSYPTGGTEMDVVDPAGRVAHYLYDTSLNGHLTEVTTYAPGGSTVVNDVKYSYGGCTGATADQMCSSTDPRGNVVHYTYTTTYSGGSSILGLPKVASVSDRNGNTTSYTYSSSPDQLTAVRASEEAVYKTIDTTGRVGEVDQGSTGSSCASGSSGQFCHVTLNTWDASGGTTCRQPDAAADNNLCEVVRQSGGSTPNEDTRFVYDAEGGMLLQRQVLSGGNLDSTTGYHLQYVESGGTVNQFDDTPTGSGNVCSSPTGGGCSTSARADGSTVLYLRDQTATLTPRGNAAGSGYAAYETTYKVDDTATVPANQHPAQTICGATGYNTGSVCEVDAPVFDGTHASVTKYSYDTNGQRLTMTTPASIAETPSGQTPPAYTYYYYPDPAQSADTTQTKDLAQVTPTGGWLKAVKDPNGNFVAYAYDPAGDVVRTWDRDATKGYSVNDFPGTVSGSAGSSGVAPPCTYAESRYQAGSGYGQCPTSLTAAAYTAPWRSLLLQRDQLGNTTTYAVDGGGDRTTITPPRGNQAGNNSYDIQQTFDANQNLLTTLMPVERSKSLPATRMTYDAFDNKVSSTDPNGHATVSTYDAANRLVQTTVARGSGSTASGYCRSATSADAPIAAGDVVCDTKFAHDGVDNQIQVQDQDGQTTTTTFDGAHRAIQTVGPRQMTYGDGTTGGTLTKTVYDADGHVTLVCLPRQFAQGEGGFAPSAACALPAVYGTSSQYDVTGRRTSTTTYRDANTPETAQTSYDADGNAVCVTNPIGVQQGLPQGFVCPTTQSALQSASPLPQYTTVTLYDLLDRKIQQTVPRDAWHDFSTVWNYDPVGNTTSTVQPGSLDTGPGGAALVVDGSSHPRGNPYVVSASQQLASLTLQNGGWVSVQGASNVLFLVAGAVSVCATCGITAAGQGSAGGAGGTSPTSGAGSSGSGAGAGGGGSLGVSGGGGGGGATHATMGTSGNAPTGATGGASSSQLVGNADLGGVGEPGAGSGGAGYAPASAGGAGGNGGGAVHITADSISVSAGGVIAADGAAGQSVASAASGGGGGGGGAGGSVWLTASSVTLSGSNAITVGGGVGGAGAVAGSNGGTGGSGRVRIDADVLSGGTDGGTEPTWGSYSRHVVGRITAYGFDVDNRLTDTVTGSDNLIAAQAGTVSIDGGSNVHTRVVYDADGNVTTHYEPRAFAQGSSPDSRFMTRTLFDQDEHAYEQDVPRYNDGDSTYGPVSIADPTTGQDNQATQCPANKTSLGYASTVHVCTTTVTYDGAGNVILERMPTSNGTDNRYVQIGYTEDNRQLTVDQPSPASTSSSNGCPSAGTPPPTGATQRALSCSQYDGDGKVLQSTDPNGNHTSSTYSADELLLTSTVQQTAFTHTTTYAYDAGGDQTSVTDSAGVQTTTAYLPDGLKKSQTQAAQDSTTADALCPGGDKYQATTQYAYDLAGNPTRVTSPSATAADCTNPGGAATLNTYTADNLLASTTIPISVPAGSSASQQRDRLVQYGYDRGGRTVSQTTSFVDGTGAVQSTGVSGDVNPATQTWTYFADDRTAQTVGRGGSPTISYTYDAAGHPASVGQSGGATVTAGYYLDGLVRQVYDDSTTNSDARLNAYAYDGAGQPDGREDLNAQNGTTVTNSTAWHLGDAEKQSSMSSNFTPSTLTQWSYDVGGRPVTETDHNGDSVSYTWDADNTLTNETVKNSGGTVLSAWCYTYDQGERVATANYSKTQSTCSGGTQYTYGYNPAGRLSSFQVAGTSTTPEIEYDRDGNRLNYTAPGSTSASTFAYRADDSISQSTRGGTATPYTYFAFGGLATDECNTYQYDGLGRDTSTAVAGSSGCGGTATTVTYTYDGLNRQRSHAESASGTNTLLHYNGLTPTVEIEEAKSGSASTDTVYELDSAATHMTLVKGGTTTQTLHDDGQGDVAMVTSSSTSCATRFDPWGQLRTADSMSACTSSVTPNDFYYRDSRQDQTTGQDQMGARVYDPTKASFTTPDWAAAAAPKSSPAVGTDPLTRNTYAYVNGDPVNLMDPSGHEPIGSFGDFNDSYYYGHRNAAGRPVPVADQVRWHQSNDRRQTGDRPAALPVFHKYEVSICIIAADICQWVQMSHLPDQRSVDAICQTKAFNHMSVGSCQMSADVEYLQFTGAAGEPLAECLSGCENLHQLNPILGQALNELLQAGSVAGASLLKKIIGRLATGPEADLPPTRPWEGPNEGLVWDETGQLTRADVIESLPTPGGMSNPAFGKLIGWGSSASGAEARLAGLTIEDVAAMRARGLTSNMARYWEAFYTFEHFRTGQLTAANRAELMSQIADMLERLPRGR